MTEQLHQEWAHIWRPPPESKGLFSKTIDDDHNQAPPAIFYFPGSHPLCCSSGRRDPDQAVAPLPSAACLGCTVVAQSQHSDASRDWQRPTVWSCIGRPWRWPIG